MEIWRTTLNLHKDQDVVWLLHAQCSIKEECRSLAEPLLRLSVVSTMKGPAGFHLDGLYNELVSQGVRSKRPV